MRCVALPLFILALQLVASGFKMLIEVTSDGELERLLGIERGFLLDADYSAKSVRIHWIGCRFCDPENIVGESPSNKRAKGSGELWFSNICEQIIKKAEEFSEKGYDIVYCEVCDPMGKEDV